MDKRPELISVKGASRLPNTIQPQHICGGNLFLSLKLDAQISLDFAVSLNVEVVKLFFFF